MALEPKTSDLSFSNAQPREVDAVAAVRLLNEKGLGQGGLQQLASTFHVSCSSLESALQELGIRALGLHRRGLPRDEIGRLLRLTPAEVKALLLFTGATLVGGPRKFEHALAARFYEDGWRQSEIASYFSVSDTTVIYALRQAGLKPPRVPRSGRVVSADPIDPVAHRFDVELALKLYREGERVITIAQKCRVSVKTIQRAVSEILTGPRSSGRPKKIDPEAAKALYAQGLSTREIGRRLGVFHASVGRVLRAAGVELRHEPAPTPDSAPVLDGHGPAEQEPIEAASLTLARGAEIYLASLPEAGKRPATCDAYRVDLENFVAHFGGDYLLATVTTEDVSDFLAQQSERGASKATLRRRLSVASSLFRFWFLRKIVPISPTEFVKRVKIPEITPEGLTPSEIAALLNEASGERSTELRDRLVLELLVCGARAHEISKLSFEEGVLAVTKSVKALTVTKGHRERLVPLRPSAVEALRTYLINGRPALDRDEETNQKRLVLARTGAPLRRADVWRVVRRAQESAGLTGRISPSTLRRSFVEQLPRLLAVEMERS
jgi:integrase/recombinase XerD